MKTDHGYLPIEQIKPGMRVLAWNEKTGQLAYSLVQQTFVRTANEIYRVKYDDDSVIETTWSHPFYITGKGWVKGKDLQPGMKSPTAKAIADHNQRIAMSGGYKLPVKMVSFQNDLTGKSEASVLLSEDLPGAMTIETVEVLPGKETVYNFSVEDTHSYFVGEYGMLVHNGGYSDATIKGFSEHAQSDRAEIAAKNLRLVKEVLTNKPDSFIDPKGQVFKRVAQESGALVYECIAECRTIAKEKIVVQSDGTVLQRLEMEGFDGVFVNQLFDQYGDKLKKPLDSVTAKNMAIVNYQDGPGANDRRTYLVVEDEQIRINLDEQTNDARTNNLTGIGKTDGRLFLNIGRAAYENDVISMDVSSLWRINNGSHDGRAIDIKWITYRTENEGETETAYFSRAYDPNQGAWRHCSNYTGSGDINACGPAASASQYEKLDDFQNSFLDQPGSRSVIWPWGYGGHNYLDDPNYSWVWKDAAGFDGKGQPIWRANAVANSLKWETYIKSESVLGQALKWAFVHRNHGHLSVDDGNGAGSW